MEKKGAVSGQERWRTWTFELCVFVYIICAICDFFFLMDGKEDSFLTETALVAILERALEEKFGQIRETMSELQLSVNFLSDRFDNVLQRLSDLETNCDSVKMRITIWRQKYWDYQEFSNDTAQS